jgi:hypothetical protein
LESLITTGRNDISVQKQLLSLLLSKDKIKMGIYRYVMKFPNESFTRFEVITAVKMSKLVFWVATPCELAGRYQRFGRTYHLHPQG